MSVQVPNGVVDVAVADEAEAVAVGQALPRLLPGPAAAAGRRPTSGACARSCPRTGCGSTTCARSSRRWPTSAPCWSCARRSGSAWSRRSIRVEGRPVGRHRQQPDAPGRRDRLRRRRQGRPLHAALRRVRPADPATCATRRGSWSGPRSRRRRWCATRAACSWSAPTCRCRSSRSCCARPTGSAASPWPAARSRRRCSRWRGRPASSAAWASRARSSSATGPSWRPSTTPTSAGPPYEEMVAEGVPAGQGAQLRHRLRRRRHDRPRRVPLLAGEPAASLRPPAPRDGKKRPCIDGW